MEELDYQQKFEQLFTTHIRREGAEQLLEWLKKTDFFTAPASTKYHCACQHGLVMHSISVFETMVDRFFEEGDSMESFAICALLHDVCKAQFYKVSSRNVKNPETGRWEAQPYFSIDDQFPLPSAGTWAGLTMRRAAAAFLSVRRMKNIRWRSSCIWRTSTPPI